MNSLSIVGKLGHSPRVRNTRSGDCVLNLSVAVDQREKVDGKWQVSTLWVEVAMFSPRAQALSELLGKGQLVGCTGELKVRQYVGRDGTNKTSIELIALNVWPIGRKPDGAHRDELAGDRTQGGSSYRQQRDGARDYQAPPTDDDIPF